MTAGDIWSVQNLTRWLRQAIPTRCTTTLGEYGLEPLYSEKCHKDGPAIATPVLRFHLWIAGTFADAPVRTASARAVEAFIDHLGKTQTFYAMVRPTGSKSLKLARAGKGRLTEISRAVATGLPDHRYLYLTGTDAEG